VALASPVVRSRETRVGSRVVDAASRDLDDLLGELQTRDLGLTGDEARRRLAQYGPNAVASHRARLVAVLWRQVRSPLLGLLLAAAVASFFVGERGSAVIIGVIGVIVGLSVGLGLVNELRAEKAAEALHSQIRHLALVLRDGVPCEVDVLALVPGDVLELKLGDIVPADLRLLTVSGLECDEAVLTGESLPVAKDPDAVRVGTVLGELSCAALMGTVVHAGSGRGVVVATGAGTELGAIAAGLDTALMETEFQVGLRRFSLLLVYVAGTLTTSIFVLNVVLQRPVLDALLFSLAIAVGITRPPFAALIRAAYRRLA
jgi:Mg2+-importing ATPase